MTDWRNKAIAPYKLTGIDSRCRRELAALQAAGNEALLLKGVALAETVYPQFRLRHCHDLDLLVEVRNRWQFYRDRRPEAYGPLVQP